MVTRDIVENIIFIWSATKILALHVAFHSSFTIIFICFCISILGVLNIVTADKAICQLLILLYDLLQILLPSYSYHFTARGVAFNTFVEEAVCLIKMRSTTFLSWRLVFSASKSILSLWNLISSYMYQASSTLVNCYWSIHERLANHIFGLCIVFRILHKLFNAFSIFY